GRAELDHDALHRDIEQIVSDPKSGGEIIRARLAMMDRETVKALVARYTDMEPDKIDRVVENVLHAVEKLKGKYRAGGQHTSAAGMNGQGGKISRKIEDRIAHYLDSLHRPELNYELVRADVEEIMHDPRMAPRILKDRLRQM